MRISDWSSDVCSSDLVAAHLAGQLGLGLAHLRLDQRVPGLPHQRAAAVTQDVAGQAAGALDVEQDHRARVAFEHVGGEQHQQAVGEDVLAVAGDHAEAVAIAVEGDAQVGLEARDRVDQRSEEQTSELQSLMRISYAVFCLKKKKTTCTDANHYDYINNDNSY